MKKYLTILFTLVIFKGLSQKNTFELNGTISGLDSGTIQFHLPTNDSITKVTESLVPIVNGKFIFKGFLLHPYSGIFLIHSNKEIETNWFYVDFGKQAITVQLTDSTHANITSNSNIFQEYIDKFYPAIVSFKARRQEWQSNYTTVSKKYNQKIPENIEDSINQMSNIFHTQLDSFLLSFIKLNSQSYVGLNELSALSTNEYKSIYDSCYNYLDIKLKNTPLGQTLYKKLKKQQQVNIGSLLPEIPLIDTNQNVIFLNKSLLRQYTLCDFWFSNCGPCIKQFPRLKDVYSKWQSKGFEIIGISTDRKTSETDWRNAIKKYELSWTQYWDIGGIEAKKLTIRAFPTNFLLDKEGKIIAKNIEIFQLEKFLELNLK